MSEIVKASASDQFPRWTHPAALAILILGCFPIILVFLVRILLPFFGGVLVAAEVLLGLAGVILLVLGVIVLLIGFFGEDGGGIFVGFILGLIGFGGWRLHESGTLSRWSTIVSESGNNLRDEMQFAQAWLLPVAAVLSLIVMARVAAKIGDVAFRRLRRWIKLRTRGLLVCVACMKRCSMIDGATRSASTCPDCGSWVPGRDMRRHHLLVLQPNASKTLSLEAGPASAWKMVSDDGDFDFDDHPLSLAHSGRSDLCYIWSMGPEAWTDPSRFLRARPVRWADAVVLRLGDSAEAMHRAVHAIEQLSQALEAAGHRSNQRLPVPLAVVLPPNMVTSGRFARIDPAKVRSLLRDTHGNALLRAVDSQFSRALFIMRSDADGNDPHANAAASLAARLLLHRGGTRIGVMLNPIGRLLAATRRWDRLRKVGEIEAMPKPDLAPLARFAAAPFAALLVVGALFSLNAQNFWDAAARFFG